jgi:hypothetical protein
LRSVDFRQKDLEEDSNKNKGRSRSSWREKRKEEKGTTVQDCVLLLWLWPAARPFLSWWSLTTTAAPPVDWLATLPAPPTALLSRPRTVSDSCVFRAAFVLVFGLRFFFVCVCVFFRFAIDASGTYAYLLRFIKHGRATEA